MTIQKNKNQQVNKKKQIGKIGKSRHQIFCMEKNLHCEGKKKLYNIVQLKSSTMKIMSTHASLFLEKYYRFTITNRRKNHSWIMYTQSQITYVCMVA